MQSDNSVLSALCRLCTLLCVVSAVATTSAQAAPKPAAAQPPAPPAAAVEPVAPPVSVFAVDRIRAAGKLVIGYRTDAAPLSSRDASGNPSGYSIELCRKVADALKAELASPSLAVDWVAVGAGFADVQERRVDMICAADEVTQANRAQVSFSIPIFPGGVSALVRTDANKSLQAALEERPKPYEPLWRGTPPPTLEHRTYSAVVDSATMAGVKERIAELRMTANVKPVADYDAGIQAVLSSQTDVLFGDRQKLLHAVQVNPNAKDLKVLTRHFTFVALALAVPRNDDDFRLAVDRALSSSVYADPQFGALYTAEFGTPDADTVAFFRSVGVPASSPVGPTQ